MRIFSLLVLLMASLLIGCGGSKLPKTYAVTGVVTLNDKPLEGADVVLVPSDPKLRSAGGVTDAEGRFTVKTYFDPRNQIPGAMTGEYGVAVTKVEKRNVSADLKPEDAMAQTMKMGQAKSLIPKKYNSPTTSGFKVSVGTSAPSPLKLDLKS